MKLIPERPVDIGIIGCGPAGLSAAVNARLKNRSLIFLGSRLCSPPLHKAPRIQNYLGFPTISGEELRQRFLDHAASLNIEILVQQAVGAFPADDGLIQIQTGEELHLTRTLIIATGVPYRSTFQDEAKFIGNGLSYCATCDGPLYRGATVAIIAYSSEAEPEANYLSGICRQVIYIPLYKGSMLLDPAIHVRTARPLSLKGADRIEGLVFTEEEISIDGIFILGAQTAPERLIPGLEMEDDGVHIKVNQNMETNIEGVYAAGDCTGWPYQLAKSIGQGQVAALNAARHVLSRHI